MPERATEAFNHMDNNDVPEDLVNSVLAKLKSEDINTRFTQTDWEALREKKPNLHGFIDAASHKIAPNDPEARGRATMGLIALLILLEDTQHLHEAEQAIDQIMDSDFVERLVKLYDNPDSAA